ncbi:uncharacterized [Tachysurus ichikawai]
MQDFRIRSVSSRHFSAYEALNGNACCCRDVIKISTAVEFDGNKSSARIWDEFLFKSLAKRLRNVLIYYTAVSRNRSYIHSVLKKPTVQTRGATWSSAETS